MDLALRRTLLWTFGGLALAGLLLALVVTLIAPDDALTWLVAALLLLAVALVGAVVALFLDPSPHKARAATTAQGAKLGPAMPGKREDLLLRCSNCTRTFTTRDDGHRPLATLCPHCGQRGVLDAPAA